MKYLEAFLREPEISPHTRETDTTKPTKPVSSVLSCPIGRYAGEFLPSESIPTPAPRSFLADARELDSEATRWLRQQLASGPMRIGEMMGAWCEPVRGYSSQDISARIDLLNDARAALDAEPFTGDDGKFWWRLPVATGSDVWPCPHCGQPATIEDVDSSTDGERRLTFWSCGPCQTVAVTPAAIRLPPSGWVKRTEQ
jgi:hypothetical protein